LPPPSELSPLGVKLSPEVKFFVRPSILLNSRECSPLDGGEQRSEYLRQFNPWGPSSPLGARGGVKNGPLSMVDHGFFNFLYIKRRRGFIGHLKLQNYGRSRSGWYFAHR
jgi:hypothetical protein